MGGRERLVTLVFERIVLVRVLVVLRRIVVLLRRRGLRFQLRRRGGRRADVGARGVGIPSGALPFALHGDARDATR
ncbi:hypothetical protein ACFWSF_04930 [Streptomyces sp. NPDC058611]|uniref:hypothetical protein n=1 Tax=unclassified Streptomyces TaxID=2593676 RepID=UPI00364CD2D5